MLSNYFTLVRIAHALNELLKNSVVAGIYSQERSTLAILFYTPDPYTVTISCVPRSNYISGREGEFRSHRNSIDLFPSLVDAHVERIYIHSSDRVVYIQLSGGQRIAIEMFGGKANVELYNEKGAVTETFLKKRTESDHAFQSQPEPIHTSSFLPTADEFNIRSADTPVSILKLLKSAMPSLGNVLVEEILFTQAIPPPTIATDVTPAQLEHLYSAAKKMIEELITKPSGASYIYFDDASPLVFSIIPLEHHASLRKEEYPDVLTGIRRFIGSSKSESALSSNKHQLTDWINKELLRHGRTIEKVQIELSETSRAEAYEVYGSLLMANIPSIVKGSKNATIENSFSNGEMVSIPLDPALSPVQNAERYFERAKKSKVSRGETAERLKELHRTIKQLNDLSEAAEKITDSISLKNFLHSHNDLLHSLGYMTEKEQEELPPFKIFTVDGGFIVYAGKSSDNNDLLTVKFAKPNDLWFHARGSSGSHVVLKTGSSAGKPSKKAIEQTASIAAYYSKMKNAKNVPVAMTEKKYVRKPKGAPSGTVIIDREKVILVEPKLPQEK